MRTIGPVGALTVVAVAAMAIVATGGGEASGQAGRSGGERVLRFADLPPGWIQRRYQERTATGFSWRHQSSPSGWARPGVLKGRRVAVQIILLCPGTASARRDLPNGVVRLPLRIQSPDDEGSIPGLPGAVEYRFFPTLGGVQGDVRVAFAREPTASMKGEAQAVLNGGIFLPKRLVCR